MWSLFLNFLVCLWGRKNPLIFSAFGLLNNVWLPKSASILFLRFLATQSAKMLIESKSCIIQIYESLKSTATWIANSANSKITLIHLHKGVVTIQLRVKRPLITMHFKVVSYWGMRSKSTKWSHFKIPFSADFNSN